MFFLLFGPAPSTRPPNNRAFPPRTYEAKRPASPGPEMAFRTDGVDPGDSWKSRSARPKTGPPRKTFGFCTWGTAVHPSELPRRVPSRPTISVLPANGPPGRPPGGTTLIVANIWGPPRWVFSSETKGGPPWGKFLRGTFFGPSRSQPLEFFEGAFLPRAKSSSGRINARRPTPPVYKANGVGGPRSPGVPPPPGPPPVLPCRERSPSGCQSYPFRAFRKFSPGTTSAGIVRFSLQTSLSRSSFCRKCLYTRKVFAVPPGRRGR